MNADEQPPGTRERLLAASRRQIVAQGWQAASSRLVTSDAGVPLGSIRYHFGSREAMLREAALTEVQAMFRTPWELMTSSTTPEGLVHALVGWVTSADTTAEQQALLLEVMAHSRRDPQLADLLEQSLSTYRDAISAAVKRVTSMKGAEARAVADGLAAQANGLWLQAVVERGIDGRKACREAALAWLRTLER